MSFDSNDLFFLDGKRLVLVAGTYGQNGAEYRTEDDQFSKIQSFGQIGSGPESFRILTKSGLAMTLTAVSVPRFPFNAGNPDVQATVWVLRESKDAAGNTLNYEYEQYPTNLNQVGSAELNYRLKEVVYSSQGSSYGPANEAARVTFDYEPRPDVTKHFLAGRLITTVNRLKSVTTQYREAGGADLVKFRSYQVEYSPSQVTGRSLLKSVTEVLRDGSTLAPTVFDYLSTTQASWAQGATTLWADRTANFPPPAHLWVDFAVDRGMRLFDVDGDGIPEQIQALRSQPLGDALGTNTFRASFTTSGATWSTGHAFDPPFAFSEVDPNYIEYRYGVPTSVFDTGSRILDLNGDGLSDIVLIEARIIQ